MRITNFILNAFLGTLLCLAIVSGAAGTLIIFNAIYRLCVK